MKFNSNQVSYEGGSVGKPGRCTNNISDGVVNITKDTTMTPFETIKVKGVIRAQNHYKHINVIIDDLPEGQHYKDVAVVQQIQILRPGCNKIPVVL